jgi:hypothetical protein
MTRIDAIWRVKLRPVLLALLAALPLLICCEGSAAPAQTMMRSPNLNISSRIPSPQHLEIRFQAALPKP